MENLSPARDARPWVIQIEVAARFPAKKNLWHPG
jgi:hypothetical protein